MLQRILPKSHPLVVCRYESLDGDNFKCQVRLKISDEDEAKSWLEEFKSGSHATWKAARTYPDAGKFNKFRVRPLLNVDKLSTCCSSSSSSWLATAIINLIIMSLHIEEHRRIQDHQEQKNEGPPFVLTQSPPPKSFVSANAWSAYEEQCSFT